MVEGIALVGAVVELALRNDGRWVSCRKEEDAGGGGGAGGIARDDMVRRRTEATG